MLSSFKSNNIMDKIGDEDVGSSKRKSIPKKFDDFFTTDIDIDIVPPKKKERRKKTQPQMSSLTTPIKRTKEKPPIITTKKSLLMQLFFYHQIDFTT